MFNVHGNPGHSITFGTFNTWKRWGLFPSSRPFVAPPEPKLKMEEVEGMTGVLDYSDVLTSDRFYKDRTGSWEFIAIPNEYMQVGANIYLTYYNDRQKVIVSNIESKGMYEYSWRELYTDLYTNLHGKYFTNIQLEDEPGWVYEGRVWISSWENSQQQTNITISYELKPFKSTNIHDESGGYHDWLWNELFDNTIFYGRFHVNESKWRTLINPGINTIMQTVTVENDMTVFNETTGESTSLVSGVNTRRLPLAPGDNIVRFEGNGDVTMEYARGTSI